MINLALRITFVVGFAHFMPIEEDFFFVTNGFNKASDDTRAVTATTNITTITTREETGFKSSEKSNFEIELIKDETSITAKIKTFGPYATAGVGFAIFSFIILIAYKNKN
jgi:hypothetical protein